MPTLSFESLRGGLNTTDPANALQMDECTIAENVEYFLSTLGERRLGGQQIDITGSDITGDIEVVLAARHFPTRNEIENELWVVSVIAGVSVTVSRRTPDGIWSTITPVVEIDNAAPEIYNMAAASFNNKLYLCAKLVDDTDRMLVWDGTSLRLVGFSTPGVPTVADEGSGTFSGGRYYRVRYQQKNGAVVVRQSEPSTTVSFAPSGSGAGAQITKPAALGEGETDWVVEASYDNANFYQIATVLVGTTTHNDTTPITTPYSSLGPLSPPIGEYLPFPAARYITIDDDRVVIGGSFQVDAQASRGSWTPTRNAPGLGNDERIPADTDNFLDFDTQDGGGLTGISQAANGSWYAFKFARTYSMTRTGVASSAYAPVTLSKARGALVGSMVSGMDEHGRPCVYFADPLIGPSRVSPGGIQQIIGIRNTWATVNLSAEKVIIRGVYYPYKQQMWWMVASNGADSPNLGLKLQVSELREVPGGVRRGWSTFDGLLPQAMSVTLLTEQFTTDSGDNALSTRPILGYKVSSGALLRADVGDTDNQTDYIARIRTRPVFQAGLLNQWGARVAALLAQANAFTSIQVSLIRDYGKEANIIVSTLAAESVEDYVIRIFDNLVMSEARAIQVEFSDVTDPDRVPGELYHEEP